MMNAKKWTIQISLHNLLLSAAQTHHFHIFHAPLISMKWQFNAPLNHGDMKKILKPASVHLNHSSIIFMKWQGDCALTHCSLLKIWGSASTQEGTHLQKYSVKVYQYCWKTFSQLCWKSYSILWDCNTICISPISIVNKNNWFSWKLVSMP